MRLVMRSRTFSLANRRMADRRPCRTALLNRPHGLTRVFVVDHRIGSNAEQGTASVPAEAVVVAQPVDQQRQRQQRGVHRAPGE